MGVFLLFLLFYSEKSSLLYFLNPLDLLLNIFTKFEIYSQILHVYGFGRLKEGKIHINL